MREYKFRGKIKDEKRAKELNLKVGDWVYGYYFHDEGLELINEESREFDRHYIINTPYIEEFIEVIPETISQFTGLYDKNGKEIYKGDVLKYSDEDTAIVVFNEKYSYFMVKPIQDFYFDSDVLGHTIEYNQVEVIGNVVDNRELLKDGE